MSNPCLAGLAALLLLAASAHARNKDIPYVDTREEPAQAVGMREPEGELKLIIGRIKSGELPQIQFEFDSDKILLESHPTLDAIADLMLANPKVHMMVRAHTDNIGAEAYNFDLSQRRAKSVKAYLVKRGVPPPSIRYRGLGFSMPIADNSTDEGRAQNRRVEFRVTTRDWDAVY